MISFKGKQYPPSVIMMCLRWYFAYALSYRDIEELIKERGINIDHSAIQRWVVEYGEKLVAEFRKKKKPVNGSWRMDETYIKIKEQWYYLYRAVDKYGNTIDFMLCKRRDEKAARRFFKKTIRLNGKPTNITIDKSGSNKAAINHINKGLKENQKIEVRQTKYLNNIVEQDHRFIKKIVRPMKGFKSFHSARSTLMGIELHHMLRKQQHVNSNIKTVWKQFYELAGSV